MSLNSMTGYARVSGDHAGVAWVWEVKSVNGRGLELRTRLPSGFDALDPLVRDAVNRRFKRGTIAVNLTLSGKTADAPLAVNEAVLEQWILLARRWQARAPDIGAARLDGLFALKGVLEGSDGAPPLSADDPEVIDGLAQACNRLLDQLATMRRSEGSHLESALTLLLGQIEALVVQAQRSPALEPERARARLQSQVAALLETGAPLAEDRLVQEVALLVAKSDIREELDRLAAHGTAARALLHSGEPAGRKLDFLCQEFNREANTLCSKANDIELTRIGLALKAAIEQFREQVQNIE